MKWLGSISSASVIAAHEWFVESTVEDWSGGRVVITFTTGHEALASLIASAAALPCYSDL